MLLCKLNGRALLVWTVLWPRIINLMIREDDLSRPCPFTDESDIMFMHDKNTKVAVKLFDMI